ncbi:uncharacterized protein LOC115819224 [Chanos chanos]|uniref:Uncharacterized protein LOC115819224 n=1 Tax=Chanos chanos TaxID=29144 RepID=A0A6J2W354_CHACN|nr:uncharacterized protein LOC115819224 [Chanos chanos]
MTFLEKSISCAANVTLCLSALHASLQLFKDHRAPAVGFFLIALSSALSLIPVPGPVYLSVQNDLEWAGETLAPVLATFGFLWLSEDHSTAHLLLIGSSLLPAFADWLSQDGLVLMSRCVALSSLSCALTVCVFAGNVPGLVGGVALCLPQLLAPRVRAKHTIFIGSQNATGGLQRSLIQGSMALGCWVTEKALCKYLSDLKGWD